MVTGKSRMRYQTPLLYNRKHPILAALTRANNQDLFFSLIKIF